MRKRVWVTMATILILSMMIGCSVDKGTNPGEPDTDRTTPERLIDFFADAYERKDIEKYGESLDDGYLFVFTPQDADSLGLPPDEPWWGKTEDLASTTKMFEDSDVSDVQMEILGKDGPWPTEDGVEYRIDPSIKVTIEPAGEEPTTYWVYQSYLYAEIIVDPYDGDLWVFKRITEEPKPTAMTVALRGE